MDMFQQVTGVTDRRVVEHYLAMANNSQERAVSLFFENPDL